MVTILKPSTFLPSASGSRSPSRITWITRPKGEASISRTIRNTATAEPTTIQVRLGMETRTEMPFAPPVSHCSLSAMMRMISAMASERMPQ